MSRTRSLMILLGLALSAHTAVSTAQTTFGPMQAISTNDTGVQSVFAADLTGNGHLDAISASRIDNRIAWFENNGDGTFGPEQILSETAQSAWSVFAADLSGNGHLDILSAHFNRIAWYENNGDGTFGAQQDITTITDAGRDVFAADLNGNGLLDVVSASSFNNRVDWFENNGDGTFGTEQNISTTSTSVNSVRAVDLDGDGDLDLLVAVRNSDIIVWHENRLNEVSADFGPPQTIGNVARPSSAIAADLDGDGSMDVISGSSTTGDIFWYKNDGEGNFGPRQTITTLPTRTPSLFAADLNKNGFLDIISASSSNNTIYWYENIDGLGTFGLPQVVTSLSLSSESVFAADLDGDGNIDILSGAFGDNPIAWYKNLTPPPAAIDVTPLNLDFGNVELGDAPTSLTATVENTGGADLLTTTTLTNDGGGVFTLIGIPGNPLMGLATSGLTVTFQPTTLNTFTGEVTLTSNDPTSPSITIALTGTGVDTIAPTSEVTGPSGAISQVDSTFDVVYTASDNTGGSGLASMELFYQLDGGGYVSYGVFTSSPIAFDTSTTGGDGTYDFYTLATDNAGNVETKSPTAESSVTFTSVTSVGDWEILVD